LAASAGGEYGQQWVVEKSWQIILTFEPLLSGLGVTASLVEVVAGTDRGDGTSDLESSGHGCFCC
jgi:hypothetical protein